MITAALLILVLCLAAITAAQQYMIAELHRRQRVMAADLDGLRYLLEHVGSVSHLQEYRREHHEI
jgi:hypothetical protein